MTATTNTTISIAVIAILAALAVLGIVVVMVAVAIPLQQAEARGCESGFPESSPSFNASKGRCFGH
jgi:flagellar basal body-associated protein FliL